MSFRKICGLLACLSLLCCIALLPAHAETTVSVTDAAYGANGSDTADDTAAIQKALDLGKTATTANPLVVNVPAGTYYISSELKIYSNTTLKLDAKATIVRSNDTTRMLASGYGQNTTEGQKGGYNQLQNVTITGGTWDGNVQKNGSGQGSNAINLMTLWHGKNITFSNMTMKSVCGTHFVEFNSIDTLKVTGVTFQDFVPYSGLTYDYTTVADGDVADKVEGVSVYSEAVQLDYAMQSNSVSAYPYDKTPCKNVTISGCTFKNCLSGIGNHHSDVVSTNITISGNTFTNMSASCINLPNMTGVTVSGNTATNVRAFLRASYGTVVTVSNNTVTYGFTSVTSQLQQDVFNFISATATLTGNKVYGAGKRAVIATDGAVTLDGNTFDLSSFRPDGYNAVQMSGTKVKIVNNAITNAASTAIDLINVKGASGYTQVEGNTITTTGSQGIRLESCDGLTVNDNTVKGVSAIGIRVMSSTGITVSGNTIPKAATQAISIEGSAVTADKNIIETPGENGIVANASSTLNATGNTITGAKSNGISVMGSTATLTSNKISSCSGQGIRAEGSTVTANSNTITSPGGNGLMILGGSTITANSNTVTGAGSNGVSITDSAATMSGNTITNSTGSGIRIADSAKKITISNTTVNGVTGSGVNAVYVSNATNVTLNGCTVTGATAAGIRVVDHSNVTIKGGQVKNAATMGINVADSTVTVTGVTVSNPGQHGIYLNGATFAVTSNTITGVQSGYYGIRIVDSDSTVSSGTLLDNSGTVSNLATGKVIDKLDTPRISRVSRASNGVLIEWNEVFGAYKYRVFLKSETGSWKKLADTDEASYLWTAAEFGKTYTFTVRCIGTVEGSFTSDYDTAGTTFEYGYLNTPKITSIADAAGGVKITWGKVDGAAKYRVFYKNGSSWKKIADTTATSYTWTAAESGTTYTFTVRCVSEDGATFTSDYDTVGTQFKYAAANMPKISSITKADNGVKITWSAVTGAAKYRVFYKNGSSWKKIADTTATSYTWMAAESGTTYTFTVRCVSADGATFTSDYDTVGTQFKYDGLSAPKLSSVSNAATGVTVSWGAVSGAAKYRVFYKANGSGWTKIADTTATSYTWTGATSGTAYTFTVRCVSADGSSFTSAYDTTGKSLTYIAAPKISALDSVAGGVKITWGKVTGAAKYRVFYKNGSSWSKIADTADTSYTWTGAKSGTAYTFTVRCVSADGSAFTSAYDTAGKSITFTNGQLATPKISSVSNAATGVTVSWGAVSGAAKYRVFYKANGSGWTKIADTTATSYTWTGAKSGTAYTFTVRCVSADGSTFTSAYDTTGKSLTYIAAPKISALESVADGVKITWGAVSGAAKYRVFYKNGSSWSKIADTTATSYTWTGAKSGTSYTFTVRCVSADGSAFTSAYDTTGKSITFTSGQLATPKLSSVENTTTGVKIAWGAVSGAAKYRVFYKANGSGWTKIADTTATSYTWTGAKSGTAYTFTVRCVSADGSTFTSAYDTTGKSLTYIAAPKLSSVENVTGGVKITWGKVTGAAKYRVFYKANGSSWTKVADTTDTSYTWTGAKSGTTYTFTVRCLSSDGTSYTSAYDTTGMTIAH